MFILFIIYSFFSSFVYSLIDLFVYSVIQTFIHSSLIPDLKILHIYRRNRFFPAKVCSPTEVPSHLKRSFAKISSEQLIVKWISENSFTAVRRTSLLPVGQTVLDQQYASQNSEINARYLLALQMLNS